MSIAKKPHFFTSHISKVLVSNALFSRIEHGDQAMVSKMQLTLPAVVRLCRGLKSILLLLPRFTIIPAESDSRRI